MVRYCPLLLLYRNINLQACRMRRVPQSNFSEMVFVAEPRVELPVMCETGSRITCARGGMP